jgi:superfamily I DNA/RNA helicase
MNVETLAYTYQRVVLAVEEGDQEEAFAELEVADYIVFLLAFDTYMRWLKETGQRSDHVFTRGMMLLKMAERDHLDKVGEVIAAGVKNPGQLAILKAGLKLPPTARGASVRALKLRTVVSRGGVATAKHIFGASIRARKEVMDGIEAATSEDAPTAMTKFASIMLKNKRLEKWIVLAAENTGNPVVLMNPVHEAVKQVGEDEAVLRDQKVAQEAARPDSEAHADAQAAQANTLARIENQATEAAARALDAVKAPDAPVTRSQATGIATAVATAVAKVAPPELAKLDPEQLNAALTDGRVAVFAGAGAGKSSTLVSRVAYLTNNRHENPSRILVTSFNNKAAAELKEKIGRAAGADALQQMSVGTMHSLFRRFIMEFGTPEEKTSLSTGFVEGGLPVARAVQKIWEECYGKQTPPPKLKTVLMAKSKWAGNDVSPEMAASQADSQEEMDGAKWYSMYEGLKGTSGNWKPPCMSKAYENFMGRYRSRVNRLGDFTDMLKIYRDILKRNPAVRSKVQSMFDHIIVDEAQDRNKLMSDIIDMMSEHIGDGSDGKSCWIVGDDKQAINAFQGAKASLFKDLYEKEGWKTRTIRTNYRCEPEIVGCANKLIAHNEGNIPIPQVPAPDRKPGVGSIKVEKPEDEADAALSVVGEIKQNHVLGGDYTDHAVLSRTNKELHAYETACIIRGVPYARRGSGSFLGSPETKAVLGYVQLVTGTNFEKMQQSLGQVINNPNRFFLSDPAKAPEVIDQTFTAYARTKGVDAKTINPITALHDHTFLRLLATNLAKLTRTGKGFRFEEKLQDLGYSLDEIKARSNEPTYGTKALFDDILGLQGVTVENGVFKPQTFRESLQTTLRDATGDGDDDAAADEEEEDETKGLGNVSFLYKLAEPDPTDEGDALNPPGTPQGFAAKMTRYASKVRDLRTDVDKWYKEQSTLPPDQRRPPPGVFLGTVHSTKGAQWKTVFVQMPRGKFPIEFKQKPGAPPPNPEKEKERWEDERRLGYVALTRAAKNLRVICPNVVGGKVGGVSSFVVEAGLHVGENVTGAPPPETEPPVMTKEAGEWDLVDVDHQSPATGYDRRPT